MKIIRTEKELDQIIEDNDGAIDNVFISSSVPSIPFMYDLKLSNCVFYKCYIQKIHGYLVSGQVRFIGCNIAYLDISRTDSYYTNDLNADRTIVDKKNSIIISDSNIGELSTSDVYYRISNSKVAKIRGNRVPGVMHNCNIEKYIANYLLFNKGYNFGNSIIKEFCLDTRILDKQDVIDNFIAQSSQAVRIVMNNCNIRNCKIENLDFSKFTFGNTFFKNCTITNCDFSKCMNFSLFNKTSLLFYDDCTMENNNFGNAKKTKYSEGGVNYKFSTNAP